jgi:hypothetical protein
MHARPLHKLLLAAALVIGQWLAVAHDFQHPVTGSDPACQVCTHGQSLSAGPSHVPAIAASGLGIEPPCAIQILAVPARRHGPASIRAPPAALV